MSQKNKANVSKEALADQARSLIEQSLQDSNVNSSRLSTSGRKRSLYQSDLESDLEVPKDELEREKQQRRLQEAAKKKLEIEQTEKEKEKETSEKAPLLSKLTNDELDQHYYHCVNLFSKNKVTSQNAFKLQLIDYMKMMVVQKNEKAENFTLMSCTLDASAKIYACRVDKVYSDMVKQLSENLVDNDDENAPRDKRSKKRKKNMDEDESDEDADENDDGSKKKQKKHAWPKNLLTVKKKGTFKKKVIEQVYNGANLPRGQQFFLQFPISSAGDDLIMSKPLIEKSTTVKDNKEFTTFDVFTGSCNEDRLAEFIPGYCDLHTKFAILDDDGNTSIDQDGSFTYNHEEVELAAQQNIGEQDDSDGEGDACALNSVDYDEAECTSNVPEKSCDTASVCDTPSVMNRVSCLMADSRRLAACLTPAALTRFLRPAAAVTDKQNADYSCFDESKLEFLAGASHWKIKPSKEALPSTTGKTPRTNTKTSRVNQMLDFSESKVEACWDAITDKEDEPAKKLAIKTISEWRIKVRNTWPKNVFFTQINLLSTFKKEIRFKLHTKDSNVDDLEDSVMYSQNDFTDNLQEADGDDFEDGFTPIDDVEHPSLNGDVPMEEPCPSKADVTVEEDLLKPRVQVEKNFIKFAKVQKRIDVRQLKATMWSIIGLESEKENFENFNSSQHLQHTNEKICFSEVRKQLPTKLPESMANNVSVPIAFLSMLFLANEKCLYLEPTANNDVKISLAK